MAGVSNLTKEQIEEYKEAFEMFDLDKNGKELAYLANIILALTDNDDFVR